MFTLSLVLGKGTLLICSDELLVIYPTISTTYLDELKLSLPDIRKNEYFMTRKEAFTSLLLFTAWVDLNLVLYDNEYFIFPMKVLRVHFGWFNCNIMFISWPILVVPNTHINKKYMLVYINIVILLLIHRKHFRIKNNASLIWFS